MLPQTTQATSTEVEGNTTVEVHGSDANGVSLEEQLAQETEDQTADSTTEEVKPEMAESETKTVPEKAPRSERRMEKLIDKLKERTDEVSALRKNMDGMKVKEPVMEPQLPPWMTPEPKTELTWEEYQAQVMNSARNIVKAELTDFQGKVSRYEDYKEDLTAVESKYPILNPESGSYDPAKSGKIAELYQKASQADPSLRLSDFVDSVMSFHQAGQEQGKKELTASSIRRDANAAVNPSPETGSLPDSKGPDWDSMTLVEKEAWMKDNGIWD